MKYLGFAPLAYGLDIMRPLHSEALRRGDEFRWCVPDELRRHLADNEIAIISNADVAAYNPDAVFSPVNWVPYWFPGRKVKVFHGFDTNKRNDDVHFRIRGWYDLYLTQGPSTTPRFQQLAERHGYFEARETGWVKLDPLFSSVPAPLACPGDKPVVIYASTFSAKTCSIPFLATEIEALIARGDWYWLLTTHPNTDSTNRQRLQELAACYDNAEYIGPHSLIPMLKAGDVMVCDTSSIIFEFILQKRPAVTFRNQLPGQHLIDIQEPEELDAAIQQALAQPPELMRAIADYGDYLNPYRDGRSAARCLDATQAHLCEFRPRSRKPLNLLRKWKMRKRFRRLVGPQK